MHDTNILPHLFVSRPPTGASAKRAIAQLAIYALALTRRVPGLKLFDIKCAWFNEEEYCEFFPRTLFSAQSHVKVRQCLA